MKRFLWILSFGLLLTGCGMGSKKDNNAIENTKLNKISDMELKYAKQFSVEFYEEGYAHISTGDGSEYVLVPQDKEENNLGLENPIYIHKPCDSIYLAASSSMDLFLQLDELDSIKACSTKADDYAMEAVRLAIESEKITYVGKYSSPDFEMLLSKGCNLAIESTMISHSPKIKEQIEKIGIPVLVERSSYEENPLGRLEWIKLYGVLTDKLEASDDFFNSEMDKLKDLDNIGDEGNGDLKKTVAFFSISSNGYVTVRKPGDYICKMIEMAGGEYALNDLLVEEENALSTVNIGMEDFYREALNADILIYNGTIDGGVSSLSQLYEKNPLLKDFVATQKGNAYSTSLNMFQESSKIVEVIYEISKLIQNDFDDSELEYSKALK